MAELRQNVITREWVIVATERAKRPDQFAREKEAIALPPYARNCPFCPGNEEDNTTVESLRLGDEKGWQVRAVANKYPALSLEIKGKRKVNGIYRSLPGNREQGTGGREQGTGNREQGETKSEKLFGEGNREQGTGNRGKGTGEQGTGGDKV
ncbi:MAG: hypothetical protein EBE86_021050 [Hormoscilla sp. GUM202]|nr:hypothetical protein [Hormoscilla sp. GUM202]